MAEKEKQDNTSGAVGGALIGGAVGGQTANAAKDILWTKGTMNKYPVLAPVLGAGMSIGGIVGGIKAEQAIHNRKKRKMEEKKAGFLDEFNRLTRLV